MKSSLWGCVVTFIVRPMPFGLWPDVLYTTSVEVGEGAPENAYSASMETWITPDELHGANGPILISCIGMGIIPYR